MYYLPTEKKKGNSPQRKKKHNTKTTIIFSFAASVSEQCVTSHEPANSLRASACEEAEPWGPPNAHPTGENTKENVFQTNNNFFFQKGPPNRGKRKKKISLAPNSLRALASSVWRAVSQLILWFKYHLLIHFRHHQELLTIFHILETTATDTTATVPVRFRSR